MRDGGEIPVIFCAYRGPFQAWYVDLRLVQSRWTGFDNQDAIIETLAETGSKCETRSTTSYDLTSG